MSTPNSTTTSGHHQNGASSGVGGQNHNHQQQQHHHNYAAYWNFMQQPQQQPQSPNAQQQLYDYPYFAANQQQQPQHHQQQHQPTGGNVQQNATVAKDPWSQLANNWPTAASGHQQQQHHQPQQQVYHQQQPYQVQQHQSPPPAPQQQHHQEPQPMASSYFASHQHQQPQHYEQQQHEVATYQNQMGNYQHQESASYHQAPHQQQQAAAVDQSTYGYPQQQQPMVANSEYQAYHHQHQQQQPETPQHYQQHHAAYSNHQQQHHATPDLVVAAEPINNNAGARPIQPSNQAAAAVAPVSNEAESTPPDLWYGHAARQNLHGPDVVNSRPFDHQHPNRQQQHQNQQQQQANEVIEEHLDDVALNNSTANESNAATGGGVMMNLDDYFQAPESDRPQSLVSAAGAIFSMAGGVVNSASAADHHHHQQQAYHRQRSSESGSQGQLRLGLSELYTHSYYETDLKSPSAAGGASSHSDSSATPSTVVRAEAPPPPTVNTGGERETVEADTEPLRTASSINDEPPSSVEIVMATSDLNEVGSCAENGGALELEDEDVEADTAGNEEAMEDDRVEEEDDQHDEEQQQPEDDSGWDDWGQEKDEAAEDEQNEHQAANIVDEKEELEGVEADEAASSPEESSAMQLNPAIEKSIDEMLEENAVKELEDIEADNMAAAAHGHHDDAHHHHRHHHQHHHRMEEAKAAASERGLWDTTPDPIQQHAADGNRIVETVDTWSNVDWDAMNRELISANLEKQSRVVDLPLLHSQMSVASTTGGGGGDPSSIIQMLAGHSASTSPKLSPTKDDDPHHQHFHHHLHPQPQQQHHQHLPPAPSMPVVKEEDSSAAIRSRQGSMSAIARPRQGSLSTGAKQQQQRVDDASPSKMLASPTKMEFEPRSDVEKMELDEERTLVESKDLTSGTTAAAAAATAPSWTPWQEPANRELTDALYLDSKQQPQEEETTAVRPAPIEETIRTSSMTSSGSHIRHLRRDSVSSQTSNASSAMVQSSGGAAGGGGRSDAINNSSTSTSPKKSKRQENLHKRFQEASAKSRLALERLQREKGLLSTSPAPPVQPTVNLWSSSPDQAPRARPILLVPAAGQQQPRSSASAASTPVTSPATQPAAVAQGGTATKSKHPTTSTPKDDDSSGDKSRLNTSATPIAASVASKAPKKPTLMPKSQSTDIGGGGGGILKKDAAAAVAGKDRGKQQLAPPSTTATAPPRRQQSAPEEGDEETNSQTEQRGGDDRRRPSSRGSIHSAYDGYSDENRRHMDEYRRDHDWYRSYYAKRRPYSRASDREDLKYYQPGYERYRPRSTQSYAGGRDYENEEDDEENEGDEEKSGSEEYDDEDERREMEAYYPRQHGYSSRHPHHRGYPQQHDQYRYQQAYHHYHQQQYHLGSFDPAWQRYIMEYHRYYGQYPTYDQLHRMWSDQQKRAAAAAQQSKLRQGQPGSTSGGGAAAAGDGQPQAAALAQSGEHQPRKLSAPAGAIGPDGTALFALQYGTEEDSQPSLSRHGSEKSFEVRSDLSSTVSGAIFGGGRTGGGARPTEKIREPLKHSVCHAVCRFGAGGHLIMITSNRSAIGQQQQSSGKSVELRNLRTYLTNERCQGEMEKVEKFPGPLSSKDTAKLAVVQFCQKKLDEIGKLMPSTMELTDRDSVALIWRFLLLLVRQNGVAMGNDLAQLLLEMRAESSNTFAASDEFTGLNWEREVEREPFKNPLDDQEEEYDDGPEASTDDQVDEDQWHQQQQSKKRQQQRKTNRGASGGGYDRTLINCSTQTSDLVEFQFRQLLLGGNKKEALEWAIKYRLWGHALFLAMKVDQRTHTNVMTRFANSLALNDPLQTLYQMLSGGTPYAVTRIPDEKWGDWRPHLAMILSNLTPTTLAGPIDPSNAELRLQSQRQQEQQQQEFWSILTMGKTLMAAGRPYAAHFCFLCCHVLAGWDVFSPTPGEEQQKRMITLIGALDEENPEEIFTLERYHCTEVYEYAIGLRNQPLQVASALPMIQNYKWTYTLLLAEYGYREEAFRYLYQLSSTVQMYPQYFSASFARAVYEVAGKLQQFDPTVETIGASLRNWQQPAWLNELAAIAVGLEQQAVQNQVQQPLQVPVQDQQQQQQVQPQPPAVQQPSVQQQQYGGLLQPAPEYTMNQNATTGEMHLQGQIPQPPKAMVLPPALPAAPIAADIRHSREWDRQSSVASGGHHAIGGNGGGEGFDLGASQTSNYMVNAYDRHQDYDQQPYGSYNASPTRDHRSPSIGSQHESIASSIPPNLDQQGGRARLGSRSYADVVTPPPRLGGGMNSGQVSPSAKQAPVQQQQYQPQPQSVDYWESMSGDSGRRYSTFSTPEHQDFVDGHHQQGGQYQHGMTMSGPVIVGASPQSPDFGTPGSDNVFGGVSPAHHQQQLLQQATPMAQPQQQQQPWTMAANTRPKATDLAPPQMQQQQQQQSMMNKPSPGGGINEAIKSAPPNLAKGQVLAGEKGPRNQSWFSRTFSKTIYKMMPSKDEMKLPDDRNKSIIWDDSQKRWVNKNGDEDDGGQTAAPPPSDFQLGASSLMDNGGAPSIPSMAIPAAPVVNNAAPMSFMDQAYQNVAPHQPAVAQQQQPMMAASQPVAVQQQAPAKPAGGGGGLNRYRRAENRRYVDVFGAGPGGGQGQGGLDQSFAPPMPMAMGNINVFTPSPEPFDENAMPQN